MVDPVITTGLLAALERQVNAVLALDPVTLKKLQHEFGKVVNFRCTSPSFTSSGWNVFVHFEQDGIRLASVCEASVDAVFEGSAVAFSVLAVNRSLPFDQVQGLTVTGDEKLIDQLQHLHQQLEIDWERPLCETFGDIPGHMMAQSIRFMGKHLQRGHQMMTDNLGEYLQEEIGLIPSRIEVEGFATEVEQLAASLSQLEEQILPLIHNKRRSE
ncbi:hypothetical protein [uncultured Endozoicomonas sp.]|uniref:ubiquinone biosynthesis accessory factor UbiJ n=1 Tax=uncultured Endozoicomonas sp. TaxID=432652 RepID=UPI002618A203|nr:hypothetical protein [uncultured Endozoicomonas sp.]